MLAPFAVLERRVDDAAIAHLANAVALVNGREVAVIFDTPYAAPFDGQVDAAAPQCSGASADLAGLERGSTIVIDGAAYTVVRAEPDGAGMTRLVLAETD